MAEIVIFGGTYEGRQIAEAFQNTQLQIHVCVATEYGATLLPDGRNIQIHTGRMNEEQMQSFLTDLNADCCVDATHPYAAEVTRNLKNVCNNLNLKYLRVYRKEETLNQDAADIQVIYKENVEDAATFLKATTGNILITTGSKELAHFTSVPDYKTRCFARVLPTAQVVDACSKLGFEGKNLIGMQGPFTEELNYCLLRQVDAKWLVTKSSGRQGGFSEKCEAALRAGVNLLIIGRPETETEQGMELTEVLHYLHGKFECDALQTARTKPAETWGDQDTTAEQSAGTDQDAGADQSAGTDQDAGADQSAGIDQDVGAEQNASGKRLIYLIGMGPGDAGLLTAEAKECLACSDVIIGAGRMLKLCSDYKEKPFYQSYKKEEILTFLSDHPEYQRAAVVYSGDIGFYSGAKGMKQLLEERMGGCRVVPVSGISSPIYFLNRLTLPWEDVCFVSCHGQNAVVTESAEICANSDGGSIKSTAVTESAGICAGSDGESDKGTNVTGGIGTICGIYQGQMVSLAALIRQKRKVCAILGQRKAVSQLCCDLIGLGMKHVRVTVGERLTYSDERIVTGTVGELAGQEFDSLSVALFENSSPTQIPLGFGIHDEEFIRGKVPMTKEEVRTLSLSKLQLKQDSILYDVGAGTGSVSIEAARACTAGFVYAIEKKKDAATLIRENQKKFQVANLTIVEGEAPDILEGLPAPTHAFIGGSGGNLPEMIRRLKSMNEQVRIVVNAVTLETVAQMQQLIKEEKLRADVIQVQIARGRAVGDYHLMSAENPVYIFCIE